MFSLSWLSYWDVRLCTILFWLEKKRILKELVYQHFERILTTMFLNCRKKHNMPMLTESQLKRLKEHKYCSEGHSLTEFIFQPFWNYVVTLMPLWIAPNLITISGLFINVLTSTLVILHSPKADSDDVCCFEALQHCIWSTNDIQVTVNDKSSKGYKIPLTLNAWQIHQIWL